MTEPGDAAAYHVRAQAAAEAAEARRAQVLVDAFVARVRELGVPSEELTARPWSGSGRYRTGVRGWYLRSDKALAVSEDGGYYQLVVAPQRFGRWRRVALDPVPPPLQTGRGGRDGESVALDQLLALRLGWDDVPQGPEASGGSRR